MDSLPDTPIIQPPAKWYTYITVEPSMFLYMMAFMLTSVVEQAFYLYRTCTVNHGYSHDICSNLSSYPDINEEVQVSTSLFHQWNGIASHLVPIFLAFFLGAWSDKRGRKSILLAGLIGKLYFSVMITVNTMKDWPVEYVIYTATLPSALTGADLAIFAGCFAYIADVSTIENRTLRVGILDVVYLSTMPTGVALGNLLFSMVVNKSYTIMFAINSFFMLLSTIYTIFFLKWQTRPEQQSLREAGIRNPITDFFDMGNVRHTLETLSKKRPGNRTMFLWFLLFSMALYTFQRDERPMMFLYTSKVFGWSTVEFSNFRTYLSVMYVLVMLFGIPLMTKVFKWRDTFIVMLGATAHMAGHLMYTLARVPSMLYVGATIAALGPCVAPLIRSMASKVLVPAERGVAYTFLSLMENAVGLFAAILYSQIYNATISWDYPNAIFMLTIGTQAVVFIFSLTMQLMLKGEKLEKYMEKEQNITAESASIYDDQ